MMTSLKRGSVMVDNSFFTHGLYVYIQSLTTASGNRLFGSVEEHWTINPAVQVLILPKS